MKNSAILIGAALIASGLLSGCVVHDSNPDPEPMWWPTFIVRESTEPQLMNYTSPGPGNLAVGQQPRAYDPGSPFPGDSGSKKD